MQILHNTGTINPEQLSKLTDRTGKFAVKVTNDYGYVLPDGWRLIAKLNSTLGGKAEPLLHLDFQEKGGGTYAEAKMRTLEAWSGLINTGGDTCDQARARMEQLENIYHVYDVPELNVIRNRLAKLESVAQLNDAEAETLRDKLGYAPYYGGIRIRYDSTDLTANTEDIGELLIAFSGASQEQDLFFALFTFKRLRDLLHEHTGVAYNFDLKPLRHVPTANLWLDILGL